MTSSEIRQSFLDFFKSKQHTVVPSSSLMPDSPNLLFTNAGMNQFVPIFLGRQKCPYNPPRAADTQKCIRAGGKHNDLDDVGLDTYHHTFFEMLGNWSFGDYFKREAIDWAWELITEVWKFPRNRLYATVYSPDRSKGDPSDFDQEACDFWAAKFTAAGLDPRVHIVNGGKKDNFWMMGETGPCGPCSEIHVDLTPLGDTRGALVNKGDARCIEIWNLVFIQFNANPDGSFSPLPARHVDTGMGFERVTSILQCTKKFTDFGGIISNYETDVFRPIFDKLEKLSGRKYASTLPRATDNSPAASTHPEGMGSAGVPPTASSGSSAAVERLGEKENAPTHPEGMGSAGVPPAAVGVSPTALVSSSSAADRGTVSPQDAKSSGGRKNASTNPEGMGSAGVPPAAVGVSPAASPTPISAPEYHKRRLPHFERPWAKYMVTFSTHERRQLSAPERDIVLKSLLFGHEQRRYQLYAACVMPDHVHMLFEPQIKEEDKDGKPVFWPLTDLLHSIKSFTAHEINKRGGKSGSVWQNESFDRLICGQADLEEKFHYICRNPWDAGVVPMTENYPWIWTPDVSTNPGRMGSAGVPPAAVGVPPTASVSPSSAAEHGTVSAQDARRSGGKESASTHPGKTGSAGVPPAAVGVPPTASVRSSRVSETGPAAVRDAQQSDRDGRAPLSSVDSAQIQIDIAFRVIADHIRTLSFAIADGIQPGNNDRNYVLRRILRRAVRYGRTLGFHEPFFYKLVDVLAENMGHVFPEILAKQSFVREVILGEEVTFNRTLGNGLEYLEVILRLKSRVLSIPHSAAFQRIREHIRELKSINIAVVDEANVAWFAESFNSVSRQYSFLPEDLLTYELEEDARIAFDAKDQLRIFAEFWHPRMKGGAPKEDFVQRLEEMLAAIERVSLQVSSIAGDIAFKLYDTYGFPLDLTELMARERGLTVDVEGFNKLMDEQKARARAAQKKEVISLSEIDTTTPTRFVGFDQLQTPAKVLETVSIKDKTAVILDVSSAYAEMGGQVGDTGEINGGGQLWHIVNTQKSGNTWLHFIAGSGYALVAQKAGVETAADAPFVGSEVTLSVDAPRRNAIQRHHTVTHLLHWALHEVVSREASQKGSFVGPEKLTFDFNSPALTAAQVSDVEKLVNEKILENAGVSWTEVPHADVKNRKDVMQFFGDKYGDTVRVVQIGGRAGELNGYSMELCGGTHTRATGEIGLFRIVAESAVAAGVRRIEAVAGLEAYRKATDEVQLIKTLAGKVNSPVGELEKKIEALLAHQKELEKLGKAASQREASNAASNLKSQATAVNGMPAIIHNLGAADGDFLQAVADALKGSFAGVLVLGGMANGAVSLVATVSPDYTARVQAGKIIQTIAPIVGGKGGGKPDNARGGGKDTSKLDEALAKARTLLQ